MKTTIRTIDCMFLEAEVKPLEDCKVCDAKIRSGCGDYREKAYQRPYNQVCENGGGI